jgi:hypothetical protein
MTRPCEGGTWLAPAVTPLFLAKFLDVSLAFSPDGQWICFYSARPTSG